MNIKSILLVGDMVGRGRLAITAQSSVLTGLGVSISYLPTALVSNNFGYIKYAMTDTTDFMRESIRIWRELGFKFDMISIGFLSSAEQVTLLEDFCAEQKAMGSVIIVDPIMGDNGSLYHGIGPEAAERLRKVVGISDLALPNYTEACLLSGAEYSKEGLSSDQVRGFVDSLRSLGMKSVIVSSARVDGVPSVVGYDAQTEEYLTLSYREVPVEFSGTGDIFSAKLMRKLVRGRSLKDAVQITMEQLSVLIDTHKDAPEKLEGLPY